MFKCQKTGRLSARKVSPIKVVMEIRKKNYENYNHKERRMIYSEGWEIVREISVHPDVYQQMLKRGEVRYEQK